MTVGPLHVAAAVCLLFVATMAILDPRPRKVALPSPAATSAAEVETSFMPLHVGDQWVYRATTTDRRTGHITKQRVQETVLRQEGAGFRVLQEIDGKQMDSRVLIPGDDGVRALEYESAREPVLFLPPDSLTPGTSWEVAKNRRARVETVESLTVGDEECDAHKIRLERFFDRDQTEDPVWLPQGWFWVARGIGVVKRDSAGAKRPRTRDGRGTPAGGAEPEIDTLLELESYRVGTGDRLASGKKEGHH